MRITSKGQVTIPKHVREKLKLAPGDEVGFREEEGQMILFSEADPENESPGDRMVRKLVEFGDRMRREGKLNSMTADEAMELTRGPFNDLEPR